MAHDEISTRKLKYANAPKNNPTSPNGAKLYLMTVGIAANGGGRLFTAGRKLDELISPICSDSRAFYATDPDSVICYNFHLVIWKSAASQSICAVVRRSAAALHTGKRVCSVFVDIRKGGGTIFDTI